jgi:eukaryotic-like serine/threonine-protein kinase
VNWGALHLFPATGGAAFVFARPEGEKTYLDAPQFLPDGRRFLTGIVGASPAESGVCVGESGRPGCRFVLRSVSWSTFAPPDRLLFVRDGVLFAQPFDVEHATTSADPAPILDGVYVSTWRHPTAWVGGDMLAFVSGSRQRRQFAWFDRTGHESADGQWQTDGRGRRAWTRLPGSEGRGPAVLSPDGQSALYSRTPERGLYVARLDGGSETCLVPPSPALVYPDDWSPDGRTALFHSSADLNTVWALAVSGGPPQAVVRSSGNVNHPTFSPDGRWIAYAGDEAGRAEVFVVPYPPAEGRWQVSVAGGVQPRRRGDGREIYYLDPRGNLMAAEVAGEERFVARPPRQLFATGIDNPSPFVPDYAVTSDGSRFLLRLPAESHRSPELKLVLGWRALLREGGDARSDARR